MLKFNAFLIFFILDLLVICLTKENKTKLILNEDIDIDFEEVQLFDISAPKTTDFFHFYDIKIFYNKIKNLRNVFLEKLQKRNLKMRNKMEEESDIFRNFEELNTLYKYQVSCNICKKTFKTSHFLWIHNTRSHISEKCEGDAHKTNSFWPLLLLEFLEWESIKNYGIKQELDLTPEVYLKFKKCLLFSNKYIDFDGNYNTIYDFCLDFYYEKESRGRIQDFFSTTYHFLFKVLLVIFVIASLIYYSFAYYIYIDSCENQ